MVKKIYYLPNTSDYYDSMYDIIFLNSIYLNECNSEIKDIVLSHEIEHSAIRWVFGKGIECGIQQLKCDLNFVLSLDYDEIKSIKSVINDRYSDRYSRSNVSDIIYVLLIPFIIMFSEFRFLYLKLEKNMKKIIVKSKPIVLCDWCSKNSATKYWHTGAYVCNDCFDKATKNHEKIMKEGYEDEKEKKWW